MRRVLLFTIVFLVPVLLFAQTIYYKLQRIERRGTVITDVSGGQFVSFTKNQRACYESDNEGYTVGNGRLDYDEKENGWDAYYGTSYWGAKTTFLFNHDKSQLKVRTANGEIYDYYLATPPKGTTTCSLIRSSTEGSWDYSPTPYNNPSQPQIIIGSGNTGGTTPQRERHRRQEPVKRECPLCHGEKRIVHNSYPPMYGQTDYKVRCDRCGREFMKSTGHQHIICTQCNGLGYYILNANGY